jgi:hypothetical protein
MSMQPVDELAWPPRKRSGAAPARHSTPPLAGTLDLPPEAVASGAWHDDFLILGSRLRQIWGDELEIDEEAPAYVVPYADGFAIAVTCAVDVERAESVRISCPILAITDGAVGIFEFALRENAELPLARLSFRDGWLVAEHELPFSATGIPALGASIEAVGWTARRLRPELVAACTPTTN